MTSRSQLSLVAYKSRVTCSAVEIEKIVDISRRNNAEAEITGALFYDFKTFFQILEGPAPVVGELLLRIAGDPRHRQLEILASERVEFRLFSSWNLKDLPLSDRRITLQSMLRDQEADDVRTQAENIRMLALSL